MQPAHCIGMGLQHPAAQPLLGGAEGTGTAKVLIFSGFFIWKKNQPQTQTLRGNVPLGLPAHHCLCLGAGPPGRNEIMGLHSFLKAAHTALCWTWNHRGQGRLVTFQLLIAYFYLWKTINSSFSLVFSEWTIPSLPPLNDISRDLENTTWKQFPCFLALCAQLRCLELDKVYTEAFYTVQR